MPVFTTSNGKNRVFFISHEVNEALSDYAKKSGKSLSYIVREACIALLEKQGYTFTAFANPDSPGQRTDLLRSRSPEERSSLENELDAMQAKLDRLRKSLKGNGNA